MKKIHLLPFLLALLIIFAFAETYAAQPECRPDLMVEFITPPVGFYTKGGRPLYAMAHTKNTGGRKTPATVVRYYISSKTSVKFQDKAPMKSSGAYVLGESKLKPLAPDEGSTSGAMFMVPEGLPAGKYFVLACVDPDNKIDETNDNNNCLDPRTISQVRESSAPVYCKTRKTKHDPIDTKILKFSPNKNRTKANLAKSLLYMRHDETSCHIWKMNLASGKSRIIYTAKAREASCAYSMDLNRQGRLLLVYKDAIQEIRLSPSIQKSPLIKFPEPKVKPKNSPAEFWRAAYDDRGIITLWMLSTYPWDDEDIYLYKYKSRRWALKGVSRCHRFGCDFYSIRKRPKNAYFWGEETAAWHDKQKDNSFLIKKKIDTYWDWDFKSTRGRYRVSELIFQFGNKKTILTINTELGGAHIERVLTKGVYLKVGKQKKKTLLSNQGSAVQCDEAELMGKYLIVYHCSKREYDLYNLETGARIRLHKYSWVYH